jgi:trimethylamine:corrinoid methyltransferase-like protein
MAGDRLRLEILSEESLVKIEETAYRLLAEVGISLQHDAAREMLHGQGCRVQRERVFISRQVVEEALARLKPYDHYLTMTDRPSLAAVHLPHLLAPSLALARTGHLD